MTGSLKLVQAYADSLEHGERPNDDWSFVDKITLQNLPVGLDQNQIKDIGLAIQEFSDKHPQLGNIWLRKSYWDNQEGWNVEIKCKKSLRHAQIAPIIQEIVAKELIKHYLQEGKNILSGYFGVTVISGPTDLEFGTDLDKISDLTKERPPEAPKKSLSDDPMLRAKIA